MQGKGKAAAAAALVIIEVQGLEQLDQCILQGTDEEGAPPVHRSQHHHAIAAVSSLLCMVFVSRRLCRPEAASLAQ